MESWQRERLKSFDFEKSFLELIKEMEFKSRSTLISFTSTYLQKQFEAKYAFSISIPQIHLFFQDLSKSRNIIKIREKTIKFVLNKEFEKKEENVIKE